MSWSIFRAATQILLPRFELNEVFETLAKFEDITYFCGSSDYADRYSQRTRGQRNRFWQEMHLCMQWRRIRPISTIEKMLI